MLLPELRSSAATLLMGVIKADQTIRQDEVNVAYKFLNSIDGDVERPWAPGDNAVMGLTGGNRLAEAIGALRYSPEEDRLDLLEALWDVALADGEIHEMEAEFIESAAEALDLPVSVVEVVRPSRASFEARQSKVA